MYVSVWLTVDNPRRKIAYYRFKIVRNKEYDKIDWNVEKISRF